MDSFADYLNKPCDDKSCDNRATHNQSRPDGNKWCNQHTDWNLPARARNS